MNTQPSVSSPALPASNLEKGRQSQAPCCGPECCGTPGAQADSVQSLDPAALREVVQAKYGAAARSVRKGGAACCGGSCCGSGPRPDHLRSL